MSSNTSYKPGGGILKGHAKLNAVTQILNELKRDLKDNHLLSRERDAALEELKVYGRDVVNADPIFTKEGIEILAEHAFSSNSRATSQNALRCLANALLLSPSTRQTFVDIGYESKACSLLKNNSRDDEFLASRIIFLTTYATAIDLEALIEQHHLAVLINNNLSRHATVHRSREISSGPMEEMALIETLKLLFNVTHFCSQRADAFLPSVPWIVTIISAKDVSSRNPMAGSLGSLVNALINLDFDKDQDSRNVLFPDSEPTIFVEKLVNLLDASTASYEQAEMDAQVSPLLTLLRKIYAVAPSPASSHMQKLILPSEEDRLQVLGQTKTLPSRLLNLSTAPLAPQAREVVSHLLFEMSDKDATRFVQNVGYGFASGYLFQNNVTLPENALGDDSMAATSSQEPVNPVTGQKIALETAFGGPEMTKAEKEREAERLMVLFDRMKKSGIIDVDNPVHKAQAEGRFEELSSDDDSD